MLGHVALGIKHEADFGPVLDLLADRVVVQVEVDFRAGFDQLPGALRINIAVLADGVFDERPAFGALAVVVPNALDRVMHDARGARTGRLRFDGFDVAILGQPRVGEDVRPPVGARCGDGLFFRQPDNQVRFADVPLVEVVELARGRHVGRVASRRSVVGPRHDGRNFLIAQGRIVLELADADRPVNVPRRHFVLGDARLYRPRPRARLFVSQERHRCDRTRTMAVLTGALKDRSDVLGEGDGRPARALLRLHMRRRQHHGNRTGGQRQRSHVAAESCHPTHAVSSPTESLSVSPLSPTGPATSLAGPTGLLPVP